MGYYKRQQYRKRSEATEQEAVIQWCSWHEGKHPELKLIFHIPNGGSRNKSTEKQEEWQKALQEQGYYVAVCYGAEEAERVIASYLQMAGYPALEQEEKKGES